MGLPRTFGRPLSPKEEDMQVTMLANGDVKIGEIVIPADDVAVLSRINAISAQAPAGERSTHAEPTGRHGVAGLAIRPPTWSERVGDDAPKLQIEVMDGILQGFSVVAGRVRHQRSRTQESDDRRLAADLEHGPSTRASSGTARRSKRRFGWRCQVFSGTRRRMARKSQAGTVWPIS